MKRKISGLAGKLIAALCVTVMLTVAGCASDNVKLPEHQNTAVAEIITDDFEYFDRISEVFGEYADCTLGISADPESENYDLSFYEPAMAALDKLEAITAPEMFADAHGKLCESLQNERDWLAAAYECVQLAKDGKESSERFVDASERLSEYTENSQFSKCLIDIFKIYDEAYGEASVKGNNE